MEVKRTETLTRHYAAADVQVDFYPNYVQFSNPSKARVVLSMENAAALMKCLNDGFLERDDGVE